MVKNKYIHDHWKVGDDDHIRRMFDHTLEHFRAIVQGSDDAIISKTPDGIITSWNKGAQSIFGYSEHEMVGRPIIILIPPDRLNEEVFFLKKMREGERIDHFETERLHKNGHKVFVSVTLSPIRDRQGKIIGVSKIARDITERKRAEAMLEKAHKELEDRVAERTKELAEMVTTQNNTNLELKRTQQELMRREKMSALGVLLAGVSHEMNTPLGNSLTVGSSLHHELENFETEMETGKVTKHRVKEFNQNLHIGLDLLLRNLSKAIEQIVHFKQLSVDQASEHRRVFDLKATIKDSISVLLPQFSRTPHRIDVNIADAIMMDSFPGALGQVITNLAQNSLIHGFSCDTHGVVEITATLEGDDYVRIECTDNGCGVPAANINKIFDPFFTTRMGQGGSGLGLNIVFNLVTLTLGGSIHVTSEIGKQTKFTIVLPLIVSPVST